MRLTNTKGFKIETEILDSTSIEQVRKQLPDVLKADADIIIVSGQPGIGKTYQSIQYMAENPNTIFMTSKHLLLKELETYFNNHNLETIRWRGITHPESYCTEKDSKVFKDLLSLGYTPNYLCAEVMNCSSCLYKAQFKHTERVLAPIQYLSTSYLHNDDKPRFDTYIIDEAISEVKNYPYDLEYLLNVINPLYFFSSSSLYTLLTNLLTDKNLEGLESYKDTISMEIKNSLNMIRDLIGKDKNIETEIWRDDIKGLSHFNIDDVITALRYQKMYNNKIDTWTQPNIYKLFDLAQESKVIMIQATFNDELFFDLLSSYSAECKIDKELKIKIFKTNIQNKDTKVYNVNKDAYFPKYSLDNGSMNEISTHIEIISNIVGHKNVGVLSMLKYNNIGTLVPETFGSTGLPSLHWGGAAGRNTLKDKEVLIIVGTYMSGGVIDKYNEIYLDNITHEQCKIKQVPYGTPFSYCDTTHPKLSLIQNILNTSEMVDGFSRSRGLIYDNRTIIAFCHIPDQIYKEFDVIEGDKINPLDWKDLLKEPETPIYELVRDFLEQTDKTDSEIAEELNIVKDESYDVELVGRMRRHWNESKEFGV